MTPEGKVQADIIKYAQSQGFLTLRFEVMAQSGYPDLMFIGHGTVGFMEVKKAGKSAESLQAYRLMKIRGHGVMATWCDNLEDAEDFIDVLKSG